jgi:hypothetical protein
LNFFEAGHVLLDVLYGKLLDAIGTQVPFDEVSEIQIVVSDGLNFIVAEIEYLKVFEAIETLNFLNFVVAWIR